MDRIEEIRRIATDGTPKWDGWGNEVILELLSHISSLEKRVIGKDSQIEALDKTLLNYEREVQYITEQRVIAVRKVADLEKRVEAQGRVVEAAKADHWGGHFAKCPVLHCPVCDALREVE